MRLPRLLLREPLLHFLVAAAALYLLYSFWGGRGEVGAGREISVDRKVLLQFMQYRAKAFEPGTFAARFDALSAGQRQQLIDDYVREEALYREARALGLDRGDDVMRQRLVQKMAFLLEQAPAILPGDAQLQRYLDEHRADYAVEPSWTFAHVFVDPASRGEERAERTARRLLNILNRAGARFNDAPRYSDRFAFLQNYVERTPSYITSHFGAAFMSELAKLEVGTDRWLGPIRSDQGWHLLLVTAHTPERAPALAELREQVADDYRREQAARLQADAVRQLVQSYRITVHDLGGSAARP